MIELDLAIICFVYGFRYPAIMTQGYGCAGASGPRRLRRCRRPHRRRLAPTAAPAPLLRRLRLPVVAPTPAAAPTLTGPDGCVGAGGSGGPRRLALDSVNVFVL